VAWQGQGNECCTKTLNLPTFLSTHHSGNQTAHTLNALDTLPSVHWGCALGHGCKLGPGNQAAHTLNTLDTLPSVHRDVHWAMAAS